MRYSNKVLSNNLKNVSRKKGSQMKSNEDFFFHFRHSDIKSQVHHYTSANNDTKKLKIEISRLWPNMQCSPYLTVLCLSVHSIVTFSLFVMCCCYNPHYHAHINHYIKMLYDK